jgi:hypothetical protein
VGASTRLDPITADSAVRGHARSQHLPDYVHEAVGQAGRPPEPPCASPWRGARHRPPGGWLSGCVQERRSHCGLGLPEVGREGLDRHTVEARAPRMGLHPCEVGRQGLAPSHRLPPRLGLGADGCRVRRSRVTHATGLRATAGRRRPGALARLSVPSAVVCGTRGGASGRGHLGGPRIAATILRALGGLLATRRAASRSPSPEAGGPRSQGQARDLPAIPTASTPAGSGGHRAADTNASAPTRRCLAVGSCASGRTFAGRCLQLPPHGGPPCGSARSAWPRGLQGTYTRASLPGRLAPSSCPRPHGTGGEPRGSSGS